MIRVKRYNMDVKNIFRVLIALEVVLLAFIVSGIVLFDSSKASSWRLFELLGANIASLITTFGVYKMREMT